MKTLPFAGPRLKAKRARIHIDELQGVLDQFNALSPYRMITTPVGGAADLQIVLEHPFPDEVPLLIGDAIHNLRAALDIMACDIVRMNGKSAKGVYFPFAKSSSELDEQIKRKNFNRAPIEAINLLKRIKPFIGGNDVLRALHDLDILDKHDLLIPTYSVSVVPVKHAKIGGATIEDCVFIGFDGESPIRVLNYGPPVFGNPENGNPPLGAGGAQIVFDAGIPMAGVPVIQALEDFHQVVAGTIESFASLFS